MLVVDVLDHPTLCGAGDGCVVEHGEVADHLAQSDPASVGADCLVELTGQQVFENYLLWARHSGGVDLHDAEGVGLQELLEHDAVLHLFTGCHGDGIDGPGNGCVADDVIGAGGLFDPCQVEVMEMVDPINGLRDIPDLIGVDGQADVGADGIPGQSQAAYVIIEVLAYFELDLLEALFLSLPFGDLHHFFVAVAKPSWCC